MEVVINKCFGGFSISNEALFELIKMKSKIVDKKTIKEYFGGKNPNPKFQRDWEQGWQKIKARLKLFREEFYADDFLGRLLYDNEYAYSIKRDKKIRNNADLIKVVKKLGDKANGHCAQLVIVKIPDNVKYEIDEYDGMESIHEKHRSWG